MIENYELAGKYLLNMLYLFIALSFCFILMYFFYNDYYLMIKNVLAGFYSLLIGFIDWFFDVITLSFSDYGSVWFIVGWFILIIGILKIVLEKLNII